MTLVVGCGQGSDGIPAGTGKGESLSLICKSLEGKKVPIPSLSSGMPVNNKTEPLC
jgi:hypothetical protein